jgi:hypothetical protein
MAQRQLVDVSPAKFRRTAAAVACLAFFAAIQRSILASRIVSGSAPVFSSCA